MDLLLSHSYFLREDPAERKVMKPYPPLGILYISSHLKTKGVEVEVLDTTFMAREEAHRRIREMRPPVVGIYGNLITRPNVLELARSAREAGAWVVLGGPEPANYPAEYLDRGGHAVVVGEGEVTLEELLPLLLRRPPGVDGVLPPEAEEIQGLVYRDPEGELVRTPPRPGIRTLDEQPFPDREAIRMETYLRTWREHHGKGPVSLITARGCPYTCKWCSHAVFGYTHRRRSPENVVDEVEEVVDRYDPEMLWYADDVFTIHHRWLFNYADELESRGLKLPFETISREDRLNEEVVDTLARMGCFRLWIGSESGSQRILDAMDRRADAERIREMVGLLQSRGIEAGLFVMLGYEGEEEEDLEATVEHLKKASPDRFLTTVAYPIKGTPYHEEVEDRIVARRPWAEGSDRDLTVQGRHSMRYYRFANRWMVNEVALHRQRNRPRARRSWLRMAKTWTNAAVGRLGMHLTRHQVEEGA